MALGVLVCIVMGSSVAGAFRGEISPVVATADVLFGLAGMGGHFGVTANIAYTLGKNNALRRQQAGRTQQSVVLNNNRF